MMSRCEEAYSVRMMCRLLKVSPSGYYDWRDRPASRREQDNARLLEQIRSIHAQSDSVYGSPKIWEALVRCGDGCSQNRVARIMRAARLQGIPAARRWRGRKCGQRPEGLSNHLARDFAVTEPNTKWVSDITYIRTGEGWLYLAVVLDLATRRIIGWSMRQSLDRELVLQAVLMALWQRPRAGSVILHSDRGTQGDFHRLSQHLTFGGVGWEDHEVGLQNRQGERQCTRQDGRALISVKRSKSFGSVLAPELPAKRQHWRAAFHSRSVHAGSAKPAGWHRSAWFRCLGDICHSQNVKNSHC